ncbi:MAG: GNAT family N-acetyltransferase [Kutzneria sp.]|nr:GNAT family N-acetyltransferase [Kutzneria sp.]MBV9847804.1 GNAT family N-acetyltransferase [Kutzneria sp.]
MTGRANSVLAECAPTDVHAAVQEVERHYRRLGLASTFQISSDSKPAELDELLAERGYRVVTPTGLLTATIVDTLPRMPRPEGVVVKDEPTEAWLDLHWEDSGRTTPATRFITQQILTGVPAGYAWLDGRSIGRGALVDDWVGIYALYVAPEARGRGLARMTLSGLLRWAADRGATRAFLQVLESNAVAKRLYASAGFTEAAHYHYRVLDQAEQERFAGTSQ